MRAHDDEALQADTSDLVELGEVTQLTQGIAAPNRTEALSVEDYRDKA